MIRIPTPTDRRFGEGRSISSIVEQFVPWSRQGGYVSESTATKTRLPEQRAQQSFDSVYRACFGDVARWVRALRANDADVEDLTQEVFIIVRRKLPSFDGRNLLGFLYRIAQRTVRDHRRSAWFRNLLGKHARLRELTSREPTGLQVLHEKEQQKVLQTILARMSDKRRATFMLFEIEGYSGEEIAQIQSLRLKTVWTRLHHARKDFVRMVSELASTEDGQSVNLGEE